MFIDQYLIYKPILDNDTNNNIQSNNAPTLAELEQQGGTYQRTKTST